MSMLPLPVTLSASRRDHSRRHPGGSRHYRSTRDILLTRARVTNLGFFILAAFAAVSFLVNLTWYFSEPADYTHESTYAAPKAIWETLPRERSLAELDHLIVVPGHAIWKGTNLEARFDDDQWVLEPYQRGGGRIAAFFKHIVAACVLLHASCSSHTDRTQCRSRAAGRALPARVQRVGRLRLLIHQPR